jgi:hypothetical protein
LAALPAACAAPAPQSPFDGTWNGAERHQISFRDNTVVQQPAGAPPTTLSAATCEGKFRFGYARRNREALIALAPGQPDLRSRLTLLLVRPDFFVPLIRLIPIAKVRTFLDNAVRSATAYSTRRGTLLIALLCAIFGQVTTMAMYFGNAMALQVEGVTMLQVFYAGAVMTLFTFLIPTAAGEGVREFMFVDLLGGKIPTAKAFLIGHVGFWIEKLLLSFQGGIFLLWAPKSYQRVTREELERLKEEATNEQRATAA